MATLLVLWSTIALLVFPLTTGQRSSNGATDFHIGVILDLNSSDSPVGRIGMSCLSMAHSDFYSVHRHYKTRVVLDFRDSNGSVFDAAAAALDLMQNVKVDAIIGPQKSIQTSLVMDLGDRARVPIISFSATSPSLVPRTPYFVQTAQSDANQVQPIASIVKAFQWNQVVIIYEDTVFGHGIMAYLSNALQDVNVRVSYRSLIPSSSSDDFIISELNKMMMLMQTRVFLVHMSQSLAARFFLNARGKGMMREGYAWIITSGLTDLFNLVDFNVVEAMQGVLGVKPLIPKSKELQLFGGRWIRLFFQANQDIKPAETSTFCLWAYDTFWALAVAAERVGNSTGANAMKKEAKAAVHSQGPFALEVSETGPKLLQALLETRFKGLAGEFDLVDGQLKQTPYQIVNVVGRHEREVGIWTPSGGISTELNVNATSSSCSTAKKNLRRIIWPGDSIVVPRGWEFPVSGKKLRIGVPQKLGFDEILKVEKDPRTNATKVSGYLKEVFDSIMAALPYAVPHEYVAYPFLNRNGSRAGSYDDLVYQVSLQENFDAALMEDTSVSAKWSIYVDFTAPYAEGGVAIIVRIKHDDVNDLFIFFRPFTKELWLVAVTLYISTALAIWILARRIIARSRDSPGQHAGMICFMPFFPGQGFEGSLISLVLVTWTPVASLLWSNYTATLSSLFTLLRRPRPIVTDLTQLIKNGDYVGCPVFLVSFLKILGFQESKIRTYNSTQSCNEALLLGSKNGGISAYFDVLPQIRMILSQYCGKYMMVGPTYRTVEFAFAFPKGSPLAADISRAIIQLTERGTIQEINRHLCSSSGPDSISSPSSVTLRTLLAPFSITGLVTLICLLLPYIYDSDNRALLLQRISDLRAQVISGVHSLQNFFRSILQRISDLRAQVLSGVHSLQNFFWRSILPSSPNATNTRN